MALHCKIILSFLEQELQILICQLAFLNDFYTPCEASIGLNELLFVVVQSPELQIEHLVELGVLNFIDLVSSHGLSQVVFREISLFQSKVGLTKPIVKFNEPHAFPCLFVDFHPDCLQQIRNGFIEVFLDQEDVAKERDGVELKSIRLDILGQLIRIFKILSALYVFVYLTVIFSQLIIQLTPLFSTQMLILHSFLQFLHLLTQILTFLHLLLQCPKLVADYHCLLVRSKGHIYFISLSRLPFNKTFFVGL